MKRISLFVALVLFLFSCGESASSPETGKDSTVEMSHDDSIVKYPYSIEHPDQWEVGSRENTVTVLNSLKAFENGNIEEAMNYFGDSIRLRFDYLDTTVPKDSLTAMFNNERSKVKSMEIRMDDWESVIPKDKEAEYVSLWYTQSWETNDGIKDSLYVMDDMRIQNGKIIGIDEKTRKLGSKKM